MIERRWTPEAVDWFNHEGARFFAQLLREFSGTVSTLPSGIQWRDRRSARP